MQAIVRYDHAMGGMVNYYSVTNTVFPSNVIATQRTLKMAYALS